MKMGSSNKSDGFSKKFRKNVCWEENTQRCSLTKKNTFKLLGISYKRLPHQRLGCCLSWCGSSLSAQIQLSWQQAWYWCPAVGGPQWPAHEPGREDITRGRNGIKRTNPIKPVQVIILNSYRIDSTSYNLKYRLYGTSTKQNMSHYL